MATKTDDKRQRDNEYLTLKYRSFMDDLIVRLGGECAQCGSDSNLEFDHVDWRTKKFTISERWTMKDQDEFNREVDKCQLLCADCHLLKSKADRAEMERPAFTHGTLYGWMKIKCACGLCSTAKRAWNDDRNARRRSEGSVARGPYKTRER